jgi:putative membrane protein
MNRISASLLASVMSLAVFGCGGGTQPSPETPATPETAPAPAPAAAEPPPPVEEKKAEAPPPPPAEKPLTDGEIAQIVTIANTGEIEQAKLASAKAKDAKVKKLAAMIIQHHTESNKNAEKIAKTAKIEPKPSALSDKLMADGTAATGTFKDLKGADFDKAYIDAQIAEHQAVLALFDSKLIPAAQNPELKKELEAFRPKVESHLKEAQTIKDALAAASPAAGGAPPPAAAKK